MDTEHNQNETGKNRKLKAILPVALLLILVAALLLIFFVLRPQATEGAKEIRIEVIVNGEVVRDVRLNTDALYLRQALEEAGLISPDEPSMITTVNGIVADGSDGAWWIFTSNGEWLNFGADEQPIEDGDVYEITRSVFE